MTRSPCSLVGHAWVPLIAWHLPVPVVWACARCQLLKHCGRA